MSIHLFSTLFVSLFVLKVVVKLGLDLLNLNHLRKYAGNVPAELQGLIDPELLLKNDSYHSARMAFRITSSLVDSLLIALFLFTPIYANYTNWVERWAAPFIFKGIGFFLIIEMIGWLIQLPFSYYYHFHLEAAYGFNKYRLGGWLIDSLKSLAVSVILTSLVLAVIFGIWGNSFSFNWRDILIGWGLALVLITVFVYLVPVLLIPFFYKLQPLSDEKLESRIKSMMERAGFKVHGIFVADESKKSSHANAQMAGFGNKKSIILFDTLVNHYEENEILGVVAHEIGHGKKRHILKLSALIILQAFVFILFAAYLLGTDLPYRFADIPNVFYSGLFITYFFFFDLLGFFIVPLFGLISRRFEYQADAFSKGILGSGAPLIKTFEKFITRELDNINPHPIFEAFYYSHPSLRKRIRALKNGS
ncbi:MAG: M48 family metallopeptidase [Firmicutes bacterium]|nr:M48 family metallopeptidase [Bacillota bacterium]